MTTDITRELESLAEQAGMDLNATTEPEEAEYHAGRENAYRYAMSVLVPMSQSEREGFFDALDNVVAIMVRRYATSTGIRRELACMQVAGDVLLREKRALRKRRRDVRNTERKLVVMNRIARVTGMSSRLLQRIHVDRHRLYVLRRIWS